MIKGQRLPGRECGSYHNVHVGLQVGSVPHDLVPGDSEAPVWRTDVHVVHRGEDVDFRGPAVQGRPGERFIYLTWGEVSGDSFSMFRRAKLMLADLPAQGLSDDAAEDVVAEVDLTDEGGMPRCARLHEPTIHWVLPG